MQDIFKNLWRESEEAAEEAKRRLDAILADLMSLPVRTTTESGDNVQHYTYDWVPLPIGQRMETDAEFRARIIAAHKGA